MANTFITDQQFEKQDFSVNPPERAAYDNCVFEDCNFEGANLSLLSFSDCEFRNCNLSLAKMDETALKDVRFTECKIVGVHFEHCNPFLLAFSFEHCKLDLSTFYRLKIKKTIFSNCSLHETDFTEADLEGAQFNHCDLLNSRFDQTKLEKADFRSAVNYLIDPEENNIRQAKFSLGGVSGLLAKYKITIS